MGLQGVRTAPVPVVGDSGGHTSIVGDPEIKRIASDPRFCVSSLFYENDILNFSMPATTASLVLPFILARSFLQVTT